jgi:hypothetical protein
MGTNSSETLACLIIDDPLLQPQYGFVDYRALLSEMREHDFFTEIAFIPYNWRKSDPETVRLFQENPDRLAICVHGCNHRHNEFSTGTFEELTELAATSLRRMELHKQLTGLDYDPVMVFPHGHFNKAAIGALKANGYLAAFNSSLRPRDGQDPPAADFRLPATRHFHQFPVFLRHYPKDREAFKRDFEAGRPLIVVQHHTDFRNGYGEFTDFVDWLNGLGKIRWTRLSEIAERYAPETVAEMNERRQVVLSTPAEQKSDWGVSIRRAVSEFRDNYVCRYGISDLGLVRSIRATFGKRPAKSSTEAPLLGTETPPGMISPEPEK